MRRVRVINYSFITALPIATSARLLIVFLRLHLLPHRTIGLSADQSDKQSD